MVRIHKKKKKNSEVILQDRKIGQALEIYVLR